MKLTHTGLLENIIHIYAVKGVILRSYNLRSNIGGLIPELWAQLSPFPQNPKHDLVKKFTKIYYLSILGYFVGYMIYYMLPWSRKAALQPTTCYYSVCCTFVEHVKYHAQTTEVFCFHFRYCFLIFMMKVAMFILLSNGVIFMFNTRCNLQIRLFCH